MTRTNVLAPDLPEPLSSAEKQISRVYSGLVALLLVLSAVVWSIFTVVNPISGPAAVVLAAGTLAAAAGVMALLRSLTSLRRRLK